MAARFSFSVKMGLARLLVALAGLLFFDHPVGSTLGGFALSLLAAALVAHPEARRDLRARVLLGLALCFALVLIETPTPLAWLLFCISLALGCLSARAGRGEDAVRLALRLGW